MRSVCGNEMNADSHHDHPNCNNHPMVVVFGRPGAGKTTVAEHAASILRANHGENDGDDNDDNDDTILTLDLDVCVPQWMKDNFAKGVYPTLEQRLEFADLICAHVEEKECQQQSEQRQQQRQQQRQGPTMGPPPPRTMTIVSFSFVNTDLRTVFGQRFPHAKWALVDTTPEEAHCRIEQRQGHFYKGRQGSTTGSRQRQHTTVEKEQDDHGTDGDCDTLTSLSKTIDEDNSDWEFAPVTFEHLILPGTESVEQNAERVVDLVRRLWSSSSAV